MHLSRCRRAAVPVLAALAVAALPVTAGGQSKNAWTPEHEEAMRRARVWFEPATPLAAADLSANPDDAFDRDEVVPCRFVPEPMSGNAPKFDCRQADGNTIRVKYGAGNPEVFAEVVATRLLAALGFPADRMYVVAGVQCTECPADPFSASQCLGRKGATEKSCFGDGGAAQERTFEHAVIERQVDGRRIESGTRKGWGWNELSKIDPDRGGASRAQVDAFRLIAAFLAHWDNKPENQRLICRGETIRDGPCEQPVAMVQDLGATFGPDKLNVDRWSTFAVWGDAAACGLSMQALPYGGSSFPDVRIGEEGRAFLAERLGLLSRDQVRALFTGARIEAYASKDPASHDVNRWVDAFMRKAGTIVHRPPCPSP